MGLVYRVHHQSWNVDLAVKSPRPQFFQTEAHKQNFVAEAQTWVNLGMHPHIASCFYVRTLGGIPRVFAEYIEGGSLADWIKLRKLYEGGHQAALERILDIAIQFAWGLHYAHEQSLVHQDVKPANVLLTNDGTAKVSDFGLARARASTGETQTMNRGGTTMVTSGGLTPAYASPEQVGRAKLTRRTDLWSWAVSVLEMFTGEPTWMSGSAAGEALEAYLEEVESSEILPAMPEELAALLRQCFENDPAARPATMQVVADELRGVYQSIVGKEYARAAPQPLKARADALNNKAVSLIDLGQRGEAEEILREALAVEGGHQQANYNLAALRWQSGQATDMDVYNAADDEHKAIFDQLQKDFIAGSALIDRSLEEGPSCVLTIAGRSQPNSTSPDEFHLLATETLDDSNSKKNRLVLLNLVNAQATQFFEGHTDRITSTCFDATGLLFLSGSKDKTARLWDTRNGHCLRVLQEDSEEKFGDFRVALSPNARFAFTNYWVSSYGVSGSIWTYKARLWDAINGRCLRVWEGTGEKSRNYCFFSPDGNQAVIIEPVDSLSNGLNLSNRLIDIESNRHIRDIKFEDGYQFIGFSPSGDYIVKNDKSISLLEAGSLNIIHSFHEDKAGISVVCVSADGKSLVSSGHDKKARLWDVPSGSCLRVFDARIFDALGQEMRSIKVSEDGNWAISVSSYSIKFWNLSSLCPIVSFALAIPRSTQELSLRDRTFENAIAEAQKAETQGQFAQAVSKIRQAQEVPGYEREPVAIEAMDRLGQHGIRSGLRDAWPVKSLKGHTEPVECVAISPCGRFIVSGGNTLRLWEADNGECKWVSEWFQHLIGEGHFNNVSFNTDGRHIISAELDGSIRLWDIDTGLCVRRFELPKGATGSDSLFFHEVRCSPNGNYVLAGERHYCSDNGYIPLNLWNVESGQLIRSFIGHLGGVASISFSPNGKYIVSAGEDGAVRMWEVATGRCGREWKDVGPVQEVCFSLDGRSILSLMNSGSTKTTKTWDIATSKLIGQSEIVSEYHLDRSTFSPDRQFVLQYACDDDGDLFEMFSVINGQKLYTFGSKMRSDTFCFSPDGKQVIYEDVNNTLNIWRLDWDYEFPDSPSQ